MEILQQTNLIPQSIPANGLVTGNAVQNPNNLLDTTDSTALFGATSDVTVGNYPFSIPTGAVIVGIAGVMNALINNSSMPAGSVTPALVTYDENGNPIYYPNTPIDGMSGVLQEYTFGQEYDLWGNDSWTAAQVNNIQLNLLGNNSIQVAWATLTVFYYIPVVTPTPPPFTPPGCDNCDSDIQALPFNLARVFQATDTAFLLESFNDAGGNPITLDMIGDCGGTIEMTLDPDLPRGVAGANFVENVTIDSSVATISITTQGVLIELSSLDYRGKGFSEPYGHDPDNISEHGVGAVAIITNNGPWSSKLVKKCGEDVIFSAPINVSQNGVEVVGAIHDLNFIGDNIQAEQNGGNPRQADVTFISNPTNSSASVENTATGTTNTTQATTLTVPLTVVDANYLRVAVITENETISGVTYDGIAMTLIGQEVNAGANLKTALYGLINPAVGANNVIVTMATPRIITAIATGWLDVDTANPVDGISSGNSGSSTAPTDTATTTTQNTIMQDVVGTTSNPTTFTQFGLWAIQGDVTTGNRPGASASRRVLVPGTVTDTYGISVATPWAIVMAGIRGISAPGGAGIETINGDNTPNQLLTNTDGIIAITQPVAGTNRFNIVISALSTALLAFSTFVNGLISILLASSTFINSLVTTISGSVEVVTDSTLTGDGTTGNPLHVVSSGGSAPYFPASGQLVSGTSIVNVTITHTLGVTPKYVKVSATGFGQSTGSPSFTSSYGVYDVVNTSYFTTAGNNDDTTHIVNVNGNSSNIPLVATVTSVTSAHVILTIPAGTGLSCGYVMELTA